MEDNKDEIIGVYTRKTKVTKCVNCGADIEQGKREGRLFCEECRRKYIDTITDILKTTPEYKESDQESEEAEKFYSYIPLIRSDNSNMVGNVSDKNTIINLHEFRGIHWFSIWIDTNHLLELLKHDSRYIDKYISHMIESSYYYSLSMGEYSQKVNREIAEKKNAIIRELKPKFDAGEITIKEIAKKADMSKPQVKKALEKLNEE